MSWHVIACLPFASLVVATRDSESAALLEAVTRQQECDDPFVEYIAQPAASNPPKEEVAQ